MTVLYTQTVEMLGIECEFSSDSKNIIIGGQIYLNEKSFTKTFVQELLLKSSLADIIRKEIIEKLNEHGEELIAFTLETKQINSAFDRLSVWVGYNGKKNDRYITFYMCQSKNELTNIISRMENAIVKWS